MHAAPALPPADPIAAATHPDPYPYYAQLVRERPLHRDAARGLWVAADAETVEVLLSHPACRVRPADEPVPPPLRDTPLEALFVRLIRMTDGGGREAPRTAAVQAFTRLGAELLQAEAATAAAQLAPEAPASGDALSALLFALPLQVTAALLGIAPAQRARVVDGTQRLTAALSPLATAQQRAAGATALEALVEALAGARTGPLWDAFARGAQHRGVERSHVLANAVGFLVQSGEATAGLAGNALLALGRDRELLAAVHAAPGLLSSLLEEVLRHDAPVQSTRRFVHSDLMLRGVQLQEGAQVLLLLAAANRDPALNPEPQRLLLQRERRRHFTFGLGAHACPGARLATAIAEAALRRLLALGVDPVALVHAYRYRPSLNGRVPLFLAPPTAGGRA